MPRTLRGGKVDTPNSRKALKVRRDPYWRSLSPGVHLGYRKSLPAGTWIARHYDGQRQPPRLHKALGAADDVLAADGVAVLTFAQAQEKARAWIAELVGHQNQGGNLNIKIALKEYEGDLEARNGDVQNVARVRTHLSEEWMRRMLVSFTTADFKGWRNGLRKDKKLAPSSVNRICNSFRAALNLAADSHGISGRAWETGLASLPGATQSNNTILHDPTVQAIVAQCYVPTFKAAQQIKDAGARQKAEEKARQFGKAFGLFVETIATTGARPVQVSRLAIEDLLERGEPRLMMPSSKKGKGEKKIMRRPVPIPPDLMVRLREAAGDRPKKASLLVKPSGAAWSKSDHSRPFARAVKAIGLDPDEVTIYALRHSSIVRQLLANVPIRVVAATHDTSAAMIEKHYSEYITDHSDEMTRATLLDFSTPTKGNVSRLSVA
jgi:hypothetical protein